MRIHQLLVTSLIAASTIAAFGSSDTDRKIEDAAKSTYNYRTLFEDQIGVKANDGVVTISGMVADQNSKNIAEDTVANLPGVIRVNNTITLDPALKEHSDAGIAWKVRFQLLVHANVSYLSTKVAVDNGIVSLSGSANNAAAKELAGVYAAEVEGVKSVKNDIAIDLPAAAGPTVGEIIDDASITSQVKYALLTHKATSALKTKVTTTDGVVVLTGEATNAAERSLAGKIATDIRGVKSVTNDMTLKS